jgi:hypothetical protein
MNFLLLIIIITQILSLGLHLYTVLASYRLLAVAKHSDKRVELNYCHVYVCH